MFGVPRTFGVLAGTVGGDYTGESCSDYCIWFVGISIGYTIQVCDTSVGIGVEH